MTTLCIPAKTVLPRVLLLSLALLASAAPTAGAAEAKWWKGNLHTHTLWSDGDDYPEMVVGWYRDNGYHFLSISDHNRMLSGEHWINAVTNRGGAVALEKYLARYGTNWVEFRRTNGVRQVRLKTLEDLRGWFERPREFLLLPGEEISDQYQNAPVHLNASNLRDLIRPQGGNSVAEVMQNNINAVLEQRRRTGQPMIPHVNHPNFRWAITAEDMVGLRGGRFFEVFNGHPGVRNYGDTNHAGLERVWDILLTRRLVELGLPPIWGTAVDDAHNYHQLRVGQSNTGRGWVMVRAAELTPAAILAAMEQGDFYASSGVRLKDIQRGPRALRVVIEPERGVTYVTQFIGTRRGADLRSEPVRDDQGRELRVTRRYSADIGMVLAEVPGITAAYQLKGDEIYVRAKVISSKPKANPYAAGDFETAWVQPLVTGVK